MLVGGYFTSKTNSPPAPKNRPQTAQDRPDIGGAEQMIEAVEHADRPFDRPVQVEAAHILPEKKGENAPPGRPSPPASASMSSEPSTPMTSASAANSRDSEPEPQARSSNVRGTAPWWRRKTSADRRPDLHNPHRRSAGHKTRQKRHIRWQP